MKCLSEVDSTVVPFLSSARRFDHELESPTSSVATAEVDGFMLERWLAKALFGLIARPGSTSWLAPSDHDLLLAIMFEGQRLSPPYGVHLDISPERPVASLHDFSLVTLCNPTTNQCRAVTFSAGSIRWLLALGKSGLPDDTYRPSTVILRSQAATRTLSLVWTSAAPQGSTLVLDRQSFNAATVPEVFTPMGSMHLPS